MNKKTRTGNLIVLEGPDNVGKSTLSKLLCEQINSNFGPCELLSFPGKDAQGTLGSLVYTLHHEPATFGLKGMSSSAVQGLHIAAHLDAIQMCIVPKLDAGIHIVLDRYFWSTWVYGITGGVKPAILRHLIQAERLTWGRNKPDLVVLVTRNHPFDADLDTPQWQRLRENYHRFCRIEQKGQAVEVVQNEGAITQTLGCIMQAIKKLHLWSDEPRTKRISNAKTIQTQLFPSVTQDRVKAPIVLASLSPAKPTVVYDTYWRFAAERQSIFFKRIEHPEGPWTDDPVLQKHKFTNAYRASDRVSQYLIRRVIYRSDLPRSPEEVFFRIILFKLFNKIETWKLLEEEIGPLTHTTYSFDKYNRVLSNAMNHGVRIYSAAYIMPSGGSSFGYDRKHQNHLKLIERMMADHLPDKLLHCRRMHDAFDLLLAYPTLGDFLAYQFVTDVNYSNITNFTEMDFVVPGPGALDGLRKCFSDPGGLSEPEIIRLMADRQEQEFERLGIEFRSLWGRRLQLIDCQNLFCEVDKYARVMHPDIQGLSGRTRIKQIYQPVSGSIDYFYPPKWNLNEAISSYVKNLRGTSPRFSLK